MMSKIISLSVMTLCFVVQMTRLASGETDSTSKDDSLSSLDIFGDNDSFLNADRLNQIQIRINECLQRLPGDDTIETCKDEHGLELLFQTGFNYTDIGGSIADCVVGIISPVLDNEELANSAKCLRESMTKPLV